MQTLCKLNPCSKPKPLRVMILGLTGVGKTALVVRFVTRRFIGDYDPNLERVYTHQAPVNTESVAFEILDSAGGQCQGEMERVQLETNIRWAEAFILMYSVTDKCSFDECNRLRFLISYNKRRRRGLASGIIPGPEAPVVLVGNKTDQVGERMVSLADGQRRARDIGCVAFREVSVRENCEHASLVFEDVYLTWKTSCKAPRLKRSTSDLHHGGPINLETINAICRGISTRSTTGGMPAVAVLPTWPERSASADWSTDSAFRQRASTDGQLQTNKKLSYHRVKSSLYASPLIMRRMSISMRGSNA
uniref:small monomeric GTPase n=1 Tax=Strigamia maritima TaxID=126957 RepID=T1JBH0_STRMM